MDQDEWLAEAYCNFRKFRCEEDRVKDILSYIRSKCDLIKAGDVTSVLAIGTGNSGCAWGSCHLLH